ncbi:MAG: alpha/beta hydrolase [Paracoccus denitrificans]|nr:MAG: alpha/beta hydrolase [Paracoccus denitrificans]PZO84601.1 MAG: alpha/beta hydrolase [Paracoccus denitrificans]
MSDIATRHWPGDPDRPAIALHCMMGTANAWGPVAERLGGMIDLRGFDMPSHGRSPAWDPAAGIDFHTTVTHIAAGMIDRPVDLIGHSIGATVALRIAVGAPDAVRSLTLIEPVMFAATPQQSMQDLAGSDLTALLSEGRNQEAAAAFLGMWGGPGGMAAMPQRVRDAAIAQIPLIAETNASLLHDAANILRPGGLEGIDAPVMLITGSASPPVMHEIVDALADRFQDVGVADVPGAGHMLTITHPDQVAGLIAANLERA